MALYLHSTIRLCGLVINKLSTKYSFDLFRLKEEKVKGNRMKPDNKRAKNMWRYAFTPHTSLWRVT
jgi:hypothetical protein